MDSRDRPAPPEPHLCWGRSSKRAIDCQTDCTCGSVAIPEVSPSCTEGELSCLTHIQCKQGPAVTPVSCCHQNKQATAPVWTHGIRGLVPSIDSLIPPSPPHKRLYWQPFLSPAHTQVTLIVKICVPSFGASSGCIALPFKITTFGWNGILPPFLSWDCDSGLLH